MNYVIHPYVFYDSQKGKENKAFGTTHDFSTIFECDSTIQCYKIVHMSLYKFQDEDPIYAVHEGDGLPINASNIMDKGTLREVYIHPVDQSGTMAVSPNNAAFWITPTIPLLSFFICSVITFHSYGRLIITQYNG